ncbi:MAG: V-type ATP synthase subunit D [Candidatus Omnitrophota bacterium]
MKLNVNPNRMELLRLRRRLALAQRGHKLLQDKLEEMMHKFLKLIKETTALGEEVNRKIKRVFLDLAISRCLMPEEDFSGAVNAARIDLRFRSRLEKIMNVRIAQFDFKEPEIKPDYNFLKVTPQLDIALGELNELLPKMIRLGSLMKSCQSLSFEIERTRRRVNALEYLLIPSLAQTMRSVRDKLNELERGNLVRLMRVKEILREAD